MGAIKEIDINKYPEQTSLVGKKVNICFHYNTDAMIEGICVREDVGNPYVMIFMLSDGRFVLSTECQYTY